MTEEIDVEQQRAQASFREFVCEEVVPEADRWDRAGELPDEFLARLAQKRYLCAMLSREHGAAGLNMATYGLLHEALGRGCASVSSFLTAHDMVAFAIARWGDSDQKRKWLPPMVRGEAPAAFALTEPDVGSDAKSVQAVAEESGDGFVLTGRKRWITVGRIARVFLVFARLSGRVSAFLVDRDRPGLDIQPIEGMLGLRAAMLADMTLTGCRIPREALLGRRGMGLAGVCGLALDLGRYAVACNCLGLAEACLDASRRFANERSQFGSPLREHQLIQRMLADMLVQTKAARLLCRDAGRLKDRGDPEAVEATLIAKYFASQAVTRIASDAVQIHGALGLSAETPVQRCFRDARAMEIIEGSTQILQTILGKSTGAGPS